MGHGAADEYPFDKCRRELGVRVSGLGALGLGFRVWNEVFGGTIGVGWGKANVSEDLS